MLTRQSSARLAPKALPASIHSTQPGGGWVVALELTWGRLRRRWLRLMRPGYVARMQVARRGECPGCPHDVIDDRDLKFFRNVCGYHFATADIPRRWRDRLPLAHMGRAEVLLFGGGLSVLAAAAAFLTPYAAVSSALLALFVVLFFRDPTRRIPDAPGAVVSPADGVITDVEELDEVPFWDGPALKIGIYLSVFDVHLNRVPETARVIEVCYVPGRFLDTRRRAAARVNEQCWTLFECETAPHHLIAVKQIAGTFARRIVCEARPGEVRARGERFGMIKFGSRTELYLAKSPLLRIVVGRGDRVRGGSSVLAQYGMESRQQELPPLSPEYRGEGPGVRGE
jgi:phosphatidylserine decarboxylase